MPKVIVQTIVSETMNTAAAANTGWQRAAIHNRNGNNRAGGSAGSHDSGGRKTVMAFITANTTSATMPSMISLGGGGLRRALAKPIISGATVMMPTASEANQSPQMVQSGAVGLWNNLKAIVPPIPETAVATTAAASSPTTLRSLSRRKGEPK